MTEGMKTSERVTVSLPAPDLSFLKEYEERHGLPSRSAASHAAVAALREQELEEQRIAADEEWYASDDAALWDRTSGDGLAE